MTKKLKRTSDINTIASQLIEKATKANSSAFRGVSAVAMAPNTKKKRIVLRVVKKKQTKSKKKT